MEAFCVCFGFLTQYYVCENHLDFFLWCSAFHFGVSMRKCLLIYPDFHSQDFLNIYRLVSFISSSYFLAVTSSNILLPYIPSSDIGETFVLPPTRFLATQVIFSIYFLLMLHSGNFFDLSSSLLTFCSSVSEMLLNPSMILLFIIIGFFFFRSSTSFFFKSS